MPFFARLLRNRYVLALVGVGIFVVAIAVWYFQSPKMELSGQPVITTGSDVEGNQQAGTTTKKGLPAEPAFSLPDDATAIDDYAFTMGGGVYMRSLTGKNPLQILNAHADSFERLADFSTYTSNGVVSDCGANPVYTYYGDNKHVYFYQIWRTPHFRTSQIEVVVGAEKANFSVTGANTATDGTRRFEVAHTKTASSTCLLTLNRTDR